MMKKITNHYTTLLVILLSMICSVAVADDVLPGCTTLLQGRVFSKYGMSTSGVTLYSGNLQGAACYGQKIYSFRQNTTTRLNVYNVYDITSNQWAAGGDITCAPFTHMGSASFAPSVVSNYVKDGQTYSCTIPFVLVSGHCNLDANGGICERVENGTNSKGETTYTQASGTKTIYFAVIDLENDQLIRVVRFKNRSDDAIIAYDYTGNRVWVFGYQSKSLGDAQDITGKSPYVVNEYSVSFNDILSTTAFDNLDYSTQTPKRVMVGGPNADGIQENLECGTVQDIFYHDNHLYTCTGRGSLWNRTEYVKIHCYFVGDESDHNSYIDRTVVTPEYGESQGLVYDGSNIWMLTTGGYGALWKYATGQGYDNFNFKQPAQVSPATTPATYNITDGSELCWFLQQVYAGRTTINAQLANDIDLSGITLPTSFYVYMTPEDGLNGGFDAQYAYRGTFDGQGNVIRNLSITKTPFYNDGLFPYCINATIKDVTVEGSIKLTTCSTSAGSGQPVANVGLIGTMDGGTLENVNAFITIDETVAGVEGKINKLIGNEIGNVTKTNCLTEDPSKKTHEQNGGEHYYVNGFCVCIDCSKTTTGYYEEPIAVTNENYSTLGLTNSYVGYYAVKNAGNMFWISKNFSASNNARKYVMTADIDMAGDDAAHQDWAGIGAWGSTDTHFKGTFDGNGHKFTNYYMNITSGSWKAMFCVPNGATIKNFTISGSIDISSTGNQIGVLGGRIAGTTTFEDIHSSVNITVAAGKVSGAIGGLVGQCSAQTTFNRCRYSGTITGNSTYSGLGGIVGNAEGILTFNNCLFDGTISTTSTQARTGVDDGLRIGGICGRNNNKTTITNSMSRGTISVPDASDKGNVGVILGTQTSTNKLTITNTYYTAISGIDAVGNNSNTDKTSANPTAITNETPLSLRIALGQENWKFVDPITEYPVPGIGGPILQVVTITFETNGGSAITPISGVEGTEVTAPANPTKEGHDFGGWVDAQGNATTVPTVMPSQDLTIYASWKVNKYTITFDTNGGSAIAPITQDYGTTITKPANPTKEDWDFNGWVPAIPSTMPAGDLTVVAQWTREEYDNGFNVNTSCAANVKYQLPKGTGTSEDPYLIDNGGKLWWFATQVGTDKTLCAKLTAETKTINTECSTRGNMPQMGAWGAPYKGTFDGNGNTISDWTQTWNSSRSGLFGYTENATIKDFTLEGTMTVSGANQQLGPIVGYTGTGTLVEDIHSKVNITANGTVFAVGGVVGRQNGTLNRCRYSGTITCATGVYNGIGGIVGETYGGTTNNCLFDGTIIAPSSDANLRVGGIVGYQSESTASTVKNSFVNGTITVANYTTATSGIVFGGIKASNQVRINASNIYYTNNNVSASLNRAAGIDGRAAMGHCENVTDKACLTDGTLVDLLGNGNWTQDATAGYPVPHKGTATEGLDANGFSYAKDGTHDAVTLNDGWYEIANGGQLLDYAEKVNAGTIALTSKARLTTDVDLEWCDFPGIGYYTDGTNQKKFQGTFDGQGHTISSMFRLVQGSVQRKGLFNFVTDATIKDFTVEGEIQVHEGTNSTFFIGGVVGIGDSGVTLEDVTSSVDINVIKCDATTRIIGGVTGRVKGTMNRCRYNGTIDLGTNTAQQVGGVLASANVTTMSNCLFDGTIVAATKSTTASQVVVGGLLGIDNEAVTMNNCLSNGTITLTNSPVTDNVGAVWGQIQKTASKSTVTYYTTTGITKAGAALDQAGGANVSSNMLTTAVGETSWADVTLALNNNSTVTGNWEIDGGQAYPIPYYFSHEHSYNQYGYCSIEGCGKAEPITQDNDGYYLIDHLADLGQFAALVNNSPNGTIINARVTEDIDVTNLGRPLNMLIGDANHHYCGTFDGQGHTFKGLNAESDNRYVGVFACVGIKDSDASKCKEGIVKNFSVSGNLKATYFSEWNTNTPLCMGVIGEIYNGTVENVHSSVNFSCNSGTRSHIGGVVGGSLHMSNDGGEIIVKNCSFTGTIVVNASDCIGGIVGYAQHKTTISHTLYAGSIKQKYTRPANEADNENNQGPVSTYIGGVLGYCNSTSNGVKNSIIIGDFESNLTDFQTTTMAAGQNNMNICVGYDGQINAQEEKDNSAKNYYGNFITPKMTDKYHQLPSGKFSGTARIRTEAQFATGEVCAELNADDQLDDDDNPWGQILGYQVGENKDPNSPAQPYPFPGYTDPEQTSYKVVQTQNAQDNTKYDYVADYYFFDDYGDTTPFPSDAASMKVKRIKFTRASQYMRAEDDPTSNMTGFISVCMPFNINDSRIKIKDGWTVKTFSGVSDTPNAEGKYEVTFNVIDHNSIAAGEPYFIQLDEDSNGNAWEIDYTDNNNPFELALAPVNPEVGILGSFNTVSCPVWSAETPVYKLKPDGVTLVKTNSNSQCFPYRGYLMFNAPSSQSQGAAEREYVLNFGDDASSIQKINEETSEIEIRYNLYGQRVNEGTKGISVVNGRKIIVY